MSIASVLWSLSVVGAVALWNDLVNGANRLVIEVSGLWSWIVNGGGELWSWSVIGADWLVIGVSALWNWLLLGISVMRSWIVSIASVLWSLSVVGAVALWNDLVNGANRLVIEVSGLWSLIVNGGGELWNWTVIGTYWLVIGVSALWNWFLLGISVMRSWIVGIASVLWSLSVVGAVALWNDLVIGANRLVIGVSGLWSWVVNGEGELWSWSVIGADWLVIGVSELWNGLVIGVSGLWSWVVNGGGELWSWSVIGADWLVIGVSVLWNGLVIGVSGVWSWIVNGGGELWSWSVIGADWLVIGVSALWNSLIIPGTNAVWNGLMIGLSTAGSSALSGLLSMVIILIALVCAWFLGVVLVDIFSQKRRRERSHHNVIQLQERSVFSLPYLYVPMFADPAIITQICKIQTKHSVEFMVVDGTTGGTTLAAFSSILTSSAKTPQVSCISTFLKAEQVSTTSYRWLYMDDYKQFIPYTPQDSRKLESMYEAGESSILTICGRLYSFDFTNMNQINVHSGYSRPIQRQSDGHAIATSSILSLQVQGTKQTDLQLAIEELKEKLCGNMMTKQFVLPSNSDESLCRTLLGIANKYFVDAKILGGRMVLHGAQGYLERVMLVVQEKVAEYNGWEPQGRKLLTAELPDWWEPQNKTIELKVVKSESNEWEKVKGLVCRTLPSVQIIKLERIQNRWLWDRYTFSKQRMKEKNRGVVNEKELFHGTSATPPEKIFKSEHGFDFRICSREGLWGIGTYFAVNARYSGYYAHTSSDYSKQLILAKVLTGESYNCRPDGSLRHPPAKPQPAAKYSYSGDTFEDERYDSVSGYTQGTEIYVIYDHDKAYPAYLITYYKH